MNIGRFDLNEKHDIFHSRRRLTQSSRSTESDYYHDLPRLILLLLIFAGAIFGYYYESYRNKPMRIIQNSIDKTIDHTFMASLEGTFTIKNSIFAIYRSHQSYAPDRGITVLSDRGKSSIDSLQEAPFNAFSTIEALMYAQHITEHEKEDMYGYGTRHFSGSIVFPEENDSVSFVFEYWIDMRVLQPVRLIVSKVERDKAFDIQQNPVSRVTYLNIRYFNWE
ncbi:MAG TPA: hypothetical protein VMZ04_02840 [Anaerolineae bacterium]|nr:hypothetical protein [Anaerolineae bacterium]